MASTPTPAAVAIGRPRIYGQERLADFVTIKMTPSQRRQLEHQAAAAGATLSGYVRSQLLPAVPAGRTVTEGAP